MASGEGQIGRPARTLYSVRGCVVWLALILVFPLVGTPAWAENRVALVIGNSAYAQNKLKNPRNDAVLMSRTLAAEGFDVMTVLDGDRAEMDQALERFASKVSTPDSIALFYYAGHGVQSGGENYLIPVGVRIATAGDVEATSLPLGKVFKLMEQSASRLNIVLLDACRNNPFASGAAASQGLASVVAPSGTIISFATAPGQVARDGEGANSPYTAALAANIPTAGVTLEEVFRTTRRKVREVTVNAQTPWEHSSLLSEFYFHPVAVSASVSPGLSPSQADEIFAWEKIRASHDPEVFRDYLARYPAGLFAELAAVRISKLEVQRSATPWQWIMTGGVETPSSKAAADAAFAKAQKLESASPSADALGTAFKLYEEAAHAGSADAMVSVARAYDKGRGVTKDLAQAAQWFERAAERGDAAAMAALGTMREYGDGTGRDLADALRLYRMASDRGDPVGQTSLGYLYAEGKGVSRNLKEARRLYQLAAEKEHPRAMFNLALFELRGIAGPTNVANAVKLLQSASDKGHARSLFLLGSLYDEGRGVQRDPKQAAALLFKSMQAQVKDGQLPDVEIQSWRLQTRREIQRQLAERGLYKGYAHGFLNKATLQALILASKQ